MSTSASASPVVVTPRRSTPSARPSPSRSSPTTRSTLMSTPRTSSSRLLSSMTAPCSLPTTVAPSPRSSVVPVPVPASRSPTVKRSSFVHYICSKWRKGFFSLHSKAKTGAVHGSHVPASFSRLVFMDLFCVDRGHLGRILGCVMSGRRSRCGSLVW